MTIKKAIEMAKKNVTENQTWNEEMKMWAQVTRPADIDKIYFLRNRRIEYALTLLGIEVTDLDLQQPGNFEELVRRHAKEKMSLQGLLTQPKPLEVFLREYPKDEHGQAIIGNVRAEIDKELGKLVIYNEGSYNLIPLDEIEGIDFESSNVTEGDPHGKPARVRIDTTTGGVYILYI